jgi:hypothetical protein
MLGIGDDDGSVRELDFVAGPAAQHLGRRDNGRRPAVGPEQLVADRDVRHGRPAGRGRERRVQGERLPHRWPCRDDDEVGRLEAGGEAVEVGEAGGDAGDLAVVLVEALDRLEGAGEDVAKGVVVLGDPALGDLVDEGLGDVDGALGVLGGLEAELDDLGADVDQAAQDARLLDDAGVVAALAAVGTLATRVWRNGAPPMSAREPLRRSSSWTVTASTASPWPYSSRTERNTVRWAGR